MNSFRHPSKDMEASSAVLIVIFQMYTLAVQWSDGSKTPAEVSHSKLSEFRVGKKPIAELTMLFS